jgi:hypothetical protein
MRHTLEALDDLLHRADEMPLQKFLHRYTINLRFGREVVAPKEQREHRRRSEFGVIARPNHAWEGVAPRLMYDCRACLVEVAHIQADFFQRPAGRTIAPTKATPDILMGVDEERETIFARFFNDGLHVIQISGVINAGGFMFDGFPTHQEAQKGQTPLA